MTKQIHPYITNKQYKFINEYAVLHHMTMTDVIQLVISKLQSEERQKEINQYGSRKKL